MTASQLSSPHCGLSSARHISPTTIGVSSIGRIRIPRTIPEPRRFWLKKSASAVPTTIWIATPAVIRISVFLTTVQNSLLVNRSS